MKSKKTNVKYRITEKKLALICTLSAIAIASAGVGVGYAIWYSIHRPSEGKNVVKSLDGTDWVGYSYGRWTSDDYTINSNDDTVTYLGKRVTKNYKATNLIIPSKVLVNNRSYQVIIGDNAFSRYSGVQLDGKLTISSGIGYIGKESFQRNYELTKIIFPKQSSNLYIDDNAFIDCYGLQSLDLTNLDVHSHIGRSAFANCTNLRYNNVSLPKFLYGCTIISNSTMKVIWSDLDNYCAGTLAFGQLILSTLDNLIGWSSPDGFAYCNGITSVILSGSNQNVNENAFFGCASLTSIDFTNYNGDIYNLAFCGCAKLNLINIKRESYPSWHGTNIFIGCKPIGEIHTNGGVWNDSISILQYFENKGIPSSTPGWSVLNP